MGSPETLLNFIERNYKNIIKSEKLIVLFLNLSSHCV